jgi:hypothetical protein
VTFVEDGGCQTSYFVCGCSGVFDRKTPKMPPFLRESCCDDAEAGIEPREIVGFNIDGARDEGVFKIDSSDGTLCIFCGTCVEAEAVGARLEVERAWDVIGCELWVRVA